MPREQDKQRLNLRRLNLSPRCSGNLEKSYWPQCQSSWLIVCQKFAIVLIRNISEPKSYLTTFYAVKQHVQTELSISLPVPSLNGVTTLHVLTTITVSFHFMELTSYIVSTVYFFFFLLPPLIYTGLNLKFCLKLHKLFCIDSFKLALLTYQLS